jgi:hypothetical protein
MASGRCRNHIPSGSLPDDVGGVFEFVEWKAGLFEQIRER